MPRSSPVSMTAKIIFTHPKERGFPARSQGWRRRGIGGFLHQVTREIPGGFPDAAVVKSKLNLFMYRCELCKRIHSLLHIDVCIRYDIYILVLYTHMLSMKTPRDGEAHAVANDVQLWIFRSCGKQQEHLNTHFLLNLRAFRGRFEGRLLNS